MADPTPQRSPSKKNKLLSSWFFAKMLSNPVLAKNLELLIKNRVFLDLWGGIHHAFLRLPHLRISWKMVNCWNIPTKFVTKSYTCPCPFFHGRPRRGIHKGRILSRLIVGHARTIDKTHVIWDPRFPWFFLYYGPRRRKIYHNFCFGSQSNVDKSLFGIATSCGVTLFGSQI